MYNIQEDVSKDTKSIKLNLDKDQWEQIKESVNINKALKQTAHIRETAAAKLEKQEKLSHFRT